MRADRSVALVTGGARGIGLATAHRLRQGGWMVVVGDIQEGPEVVKCDVRSPADIAKLVEEAVRKHGRLDGVVNAAGVGHPARFLEATDDVWLYHLDVNLMGTVRVCREAIPHLRSSSYRGKGIVNFTSQAAKTGGLLIGAPYSAAKAAVLCLTKSLAAEFGRDGIRVNAVAPGIIDTAFLDGVPGIRDRGSQLPLGRIGTPEEVAGVVAFLLSPEACYMTGEIVDVNGGLLMD